jgi:hypothetical protein
VNVPRCDRCGATGTESAPILSVTICLDGLSVAGQLCKKHRENAHADITMHMFALTSITGHRPLTADVLVPDLDSAPDSTSDRLPSRHRVQIPRTQRVVYLPDDPVVTPHVPAGVNLNLLRRATQAWTMTERVRSEINGADIDPVDVWLLADGACPEYPLRDPDQISKSDGIITVRLDKRTNTILGARRVHRKQGQ